MDPVTIQAAKTDRSTRDRADLRRPVAECRAHEDEPRRIGFLKGEISVPDDFDVMGQEEMMELFGDLG